MKTPLTAMAVAVLSLTFATAQPNIPPNEMAGRQRERFLDSPVERYMRPGPYVVPRVLDTAPARKHRAKRAKPRKRR